MLNEVTDVFDRGLGADVDNCGGLIYRDQARWFNRAHSLPGEDRKEACLGLVWANQVNARILLSRTGRRRYLGDFPSRREKHPKLVDSCHRGGESSCIPVPQVTEEQATLIRRLSIIFTSVGLPTSLDYIVTTGGLVFLPQDGDLLPEAERQTSPIQPPHSGETIIATDVALNQGEELVCPPLDVAYSQDEKEKEDHSVDGLPEDEWETYWRDNEISDDAYKNLDLESIVKSHPVSRRFYI